MSSSPPSDSNHTNQITLPLTEEIEKEGFVSSFVYNIEIDNLSLELNHTYKNKKITSPVESNWPKTMDTFIRELKRKSISQNHITMLCDVADNHGEKILKWRRNKSAEIAQEKEDGKEEYLQRYRSNDTFAEAVLIAGQPAFLVSNNEAQVSIQTSIELERIGESGFETTVKKLKPFEARSYINRPYSFNSPKQVNEIIDVAKNETLDNLYKKVKSIWKKYVDADDFHISICTADTIFTYYQDRLGLTHYLFFVGNNNSGKSNNLHVLHFLAYRNMMSTDVTSANIYQFLGSTEEGLGTICEDEADNIDEDRDKMRIHRNGYTTGNRVHRTDTSHGRKQDAYNTFCFKAFAAERLPDSLKAKGFNQRIIELLCTYGFPTHDISEVINPAGEEQYQELLDELEDTRNTLLIFRLLHYKEKIPDIKLNIHNREKQLFKPVLRVFQKTETLSELLPVISKYVSQKRECNANTLHAFLYHLIRELIEGKNSWELESHLIWSTFKASLSGSEIFNKPQSYDSVDYGIISQKEIVQTLKDVFCATKSKHHGDSNKLVFDKRKLERLGKIYELSIDVKVTDEKNGDDGIDGIHVGLDKHIPGQLENDESIRTEGKTGNNYQKNDMKIEENTSKRLAEIPADGYNRPQISQVSQTSDTSLEFQGIQTRDTTSNDITSNRAVVVPTPTTIPDSRPEIEPDNEPILPSYVYRSGLHSDRFACRYCKVADDKWGMAKHFHEGGRRQ